MAGRGRGATQQELEYAAGNDSNDEDVQYDDEELDYSSSDDDSMALVVAGGAAKRRGAKTRGTGGKQAAGGSGGRAKKARALGLEPAQAPQHQLQYQQQADLQALVAYQQQQLQQQPMLPQQYQLQHLAQLFGSQQLPMLQLLGGGHHGAGGAMFPSLLQSQLQCFGGVPQGQRKAGARVPCGWGCGKEYSVNKAGVDKHEKVCASALPRWQGKSFKEAQAEAAKAGLNVHGSPLLTPHAAAGVLSGLGLAHMPGPFQGPAGAVTGAAGAAMAALDGAQRPHLLPPLAGAAGPDGLLHGAGMAAHGEEADGADGAEADGAQALDADMQLDGEHAVPPDGTGDGADGRAALAALAAGTGAAAQPAAGDPRVTAAARADAAAAAPTLHAGATQPPLAPHAAALQQALMALSGGGGWGGGMLSALHGAVGHGLHAGMQQQPLVGAHAQPGGAATLIAPSGGLADNHAAGPDWSLNLQDDSMVIALQRYRDGKVSEQEPFPLLITSDHIKEYTGEEHQRGQDFPLTEHLILHTFMNSDWSRVSIVNSAERWALKQQPTYSVSVRLGMEERGASRASKSQVRFGLADADCMGVLKKAASKQQENRGSKEWCTQHRPRFYLQLEWEASADGGQVYSKVIDLGASWQRAMQDEKWRQRYEQAAPQQEHGGEAGGYTGGVGAQRDPGPGVRDAAPGPSPLEQMQAQFADKVGSDTDAACMAADDGSCHDAVCAACRF